ncbi:unnamed protein product [Pylaiella littoralis]
MLSLGCERPLPPTRVGIGASKPSPPRNQASASCHRSPRCTCA